MTVSAYGLPSGQKSRNPAIPGLSFPSPSARIQSNQFPRVSQSRRAANAPKAGGSELAPAYVAADQKPAILFDEVKDS